MEDSTWNKLGAGIGVFLVGISGALFKKSRTAFVSDSGAKIAALESRVINLEHDRQRLDEEREQMETTIQKMKSEHEVTKRAVDRLALNQGERIDVLTEAVNRSGELLQDLLRTVSRWRTGPVTDVPHGPSRLT